MAGGCGVMNHDGEREALYEEHVTLHDITTRVVAACGGFCFGYNIGIFSNHFLFKFVSKVFTKKHFKGVHESHYCKYNNHDLQFFMLLFYLVALVAIYLTSYTTCKFGPKVTMLVVGISILVGFIFNTIRIVNLELSTSNY